MAQIVNGLTLPDGCEIGIFTPTENEFTHTVHHSLGVIPKYAICICIPNKAYADMESETICVDILGVNPKTGEFDATLSGSEKIDAIYQINTTYFTYNQTSSYTTYPASMTSTEITFVTGRYYGGKFSEGEHYIYILVK